MQESHCNRKSFENMAPVNKASNISPSGTRSELGGPQASDRKHREISAFNILHQSSARAMLDCKADVGHVHVYGRAIGM